MKKSSLFQFGRLDSENQYPIIHPNTWVEQIHPSNSLRTWWWRKAMIMKSLKQQSMKKSSKWKRLFLRGF